MKETFAITVDAKHASKQCLIKEALEALCIAFNDDDDCDCSVYKMANR